MIKTERKIILSQEFLKETKRLDSFLKGKLKKQINKILENPEIGKPLRYLRGERSVYIHPFRLIYVYSKNNNEIIFLKFGHRKDVYSNL